MVLDVKTVAEKVVKMIDESVEACRAENPNKNIHIDLRLSKERLRELSERTHIRDSFLKELAENINDKGYFADAGKGKLIINDHKEGEEDFFIGSI